MSDALRGLVDGPVEFLFTWLVAPLLFATGQAEWIETAFDALEPVVWGIYGLAFVYAVVRPLEWLRPVERWPDRSGTHADVIYTLLQRFGLLPLLIFLVFTPLETAVRAALLDAGLVTVTLDAWVPALREQPWLGLLVYIVVLDAAEYLRHRLQHRFGWWWALHALHHSQTQMTLWSDSRQHLIDEVVRQAWLMAVALMVGVPPGGYVLAVVVIEALETLAHANVRLSFGWLGERLLISPQYHRRHHALRHEGAGRGVNFGVLFPWWDMLAGTADFSPGYAPTGIEGGGYGETVWRQQWVGLVRLWRAVRP